MEGSAGERHVRSLQESGMALEANLLSLIKYAKWQMTEGANYHPTLPSAVASAEAVLLTTPSGRLLLPRPFTGEQTDWMIANPEYECCGPPRPGVSFKDCGTLYADGSFEIGGNMKPIRMEPGCRLVGIKEGD